MPRLTLASFIVVSLIHLVAQAGDADRVASISQVLLMPTLAAHLITSAPSPRSRLLNLVLLGLTLSWVGDTLPRFLDGDAAFLGMVGGFLLAQLAYIAAFRPFIAACVLHRRRAWLGLYLAAAIALLALCLPASGVLAPAVVVYGLCLVTMAILATGVHLMIWIGGALFLVSDGLIATNAFEVFSAPQHDLVVMTTYIVAQLLLVRGALVVSETRDQPLARPVHHAPVVPPQ